MTDLNELKLYATAEHPCSYLENEQAVTTFIDPDVLMNRNLYSQLSDYGFRRSGKHVYRPACRHCNACIPIRIPVELFQPSRSQKRCLKTNADLSSRVVSSIDTTEHFELYEKYIEARHTDGEMYPAKKDEYLQFLSSQWNVTQYLEFRDPASNLIAVAVCDVLDNGISAIYTFFDPNEHKRSLGSFGVLSQIRWAGEKKLPFVYLGYWIKQCDKMNYKTKFAPYELLINNRWVSF